MEILGIGPSELIFIVIIALIILGPKDMQKAGKTIGRWLNNLVRSDGWQAFQQTSREIRSLPNKLMREANMEMMEAEKELRKALDTNPKQPAPSSNSSLPQPQETENTIQPPTDQSPETDSNADQHD